jgi:hypothetical protein
MTTMTSAFFSGSTVKKPQEKAIFYDCHMALTKCLKLEVFHNNNYNINNKDQFKHCMHIATGNS